MSLRSETFVLSHYELETAYGAGPLAFSMYVWLRSWMDETTCLVGVLRPISLHMLGMHCETHITRGKGDQVEKPTQKQVIVALERLKRVGLIRKWKGHDFTFELPLARVEAGHG